MEEVQARGACSNSLRVHFPQAEELGQPVSLSDAFEELALFGEIMRLELSGESDCVVVSYYDSRCAAEASASLGLDRCSPESQCGQVRLVLPGDVELPMSVVGQVSHVRKDEALGVYHLDFFDVRVASDFSKKLGLKSQMEGPKQKAFLAPSGNAGQKLPLAPRYRNDLRLAEVSWADLRSGQETRTTLRIAGLPRRLCEESAFHKVLVAADLAQFVDVFRVFISGARSCGTALVNTISSTGVEAVAKFFHGRQWGRSMPAAVSFAATQGRLEVERLYPKKDEMGLTFQVPKCARKAEPLRVELTEAFASFGDVGASEVSTEAGDDVEVPPGLEQRSTGGKAFSFSMQPLLDAPPGLA